MDAKNKNAIGLFVAVFSVMASSMSYPLFKLAVVRGSFVQVALLDAAISIGFFSVLALLKKELNNFFSNKIVLLIGVTNGLGCLFLFMSIQHLHPIVSGLLSRNQIVFAMVFSIFFLDERFSRAQIVGIFAMIIGSFMSVYKGLADLSFLGFMCSLAYCFLFSLSSFLTKKYAKKESNIKIILISKLCSLLVVGLFSYTVGYSSLTEMSIESLFYIVLSVICSSVMGLYFFLVSLKNANYSSVNIIRATGPIFVVIFTIPFFNLDCSEFNIVGMFLLFSSSILVLTSGSTQTTCPKDKYKEDWRSKKLNPV